MRTIGEIQRDIREQCVERWSRLWRSGRYGDLLREYERERHSPVIGPNRRALLLRATRGVGVQRLRRLAVEQRMERITWQL